MFQVLKIETNYIGKNDIQFVHFNSSRRYQLYLNQHFRVPLLKQLLSWKMAWNVSRTEEQGVIGICLDSLGDAWEVQDLW